MQHKNAVSRRRLIQIGGAAGLASVAGCSNPIGQSQTDGEDQGGNPIDPSFTQSSAPERVQFNPFHPQNYHTGLILFEKLAQYNTVTGEQMPLLAKEWTVDQKTMTISLREDYTWTNGDPVTAQDVATRLRLGNNLEEFYSNFVSQVTPTDDYTVEIQLENKVNENILNPSILNVYINTPNSIYEEYLTAIEDASGEQERDEAIQSLIDFSLDDPVSNGPYKFKENAEQRLVYEKHEEYPNSDDLNIPEFDFMQTTQGETKWQQIIGDEIDGLIDLFAPPDVVNQFPDHAIVKILRADHGTALYFQHSDPIFQDRRVRKAFCYLINSKQVAENSGSGSPVKGHIEYNTGILKGRREKYLSDVIEGFENYATQVDEAKATSLLEDAGFTKRNGSWEDPNGEALEIPIKTFVGGGDRTSATQTIVSNLNEFGIQAEMQTYEATTFFGKTLPNGNYRLALDAWGGFNLYPYFSFYSNFSQPSQLQSYNYPATEVEVPMPVGDVQGSLETIDTQKLVADLSQTDAGSEKEMELIQKLAWIWNQTVPAFAFEVTRDQTILTNDDWNIPPEDSETMNIRRPIEVLTRPAIRETISAKTE